MVTMTEYVRTRTCGDVTDKTEAAFIFLAAHRVIAHDYGEYRRFTLNDRYLLRKNAHGARWHNLSADTLDTYERLVYDDMADSAKPSLPKEDLFTKFFGTNAGGSLEPA